MRDYETFLADKRRTVVPVGFDPGDLGDNLFRFQDAIARWALKKGRAAVFAGTGLGKTRIQLTWAKQVEAHTQRPVLVMAPLAVAQQTIAEGAKIGIPVRLVREASEIEARGIHVVNYDRFDRIDPALFAGIVLDESSILKSHDGKTRTALIEAWADTRFRLACTATPAPNDFMELANHAEFLGAMTRVEMLATFFVHDGGETQKWRLKGHAQADFWKWISSWAVMLSKPSDLGFEQGGYDLPGLTIVEKVVESAPNDAGALFALEVNTLNERRSARRSSIEDRVKVIADLVAAEPDEQWIIWGDLNDETEALSKAIPGALEVRGSDDPDVKAERLIGFANGDFRVLVTKSKIAGFGLNLQKCARIAFCGVSDSFEMFYQSVRRCYRFGQTREVIVYVVTSSAESSVVRNLKRKERDAQAMVTAMVQQIQLHSDVREYRAQDATALERRYILPDWLETSA